MAYFIPNSIQKRLLRYALSRLELIDTDALDLESLDIEWGRKSFVELRDVGLRKDRISTILQLPPQLRIEAARIASLKVTVPADVYASSIIADIDGIEAFVELDDRAPPSRKLRSKNEARGQAANRSPYTHDDALPGPQDLAKSFLEQEPNQEKARLEAELASKSTDLQQSIASSEGTEDGLAYGTGTGLALPTFLANFLKGVSDRLIINVRNVSINIKTMLECPDDQALHTLFQIKASSADLLPVNEADLAGQEYNDIKNAIRVGDRFVSLKEVGITSQEMESTLGSGKPVATPDETEDQSSPVYSWANEKSSTQSALATEASASHGSLIRSGEDNLKHSLQLHEALKLSRTEKYSSQPGASRAGQVRPTSRSPPPTISSGSTSSSPSPTPSIHHTSRHLFYDPRGNSGPDSEPSSDDSRDATPTREQALDQSTMFSHEDAQSIYMSVASDFQDHTGSPEHDIEAADGQLSYESSESSTDPDSLRDSTRRPSQPTENLLPGAWTESQTDQADSHEKEQEKSPPARISRQQDPNNANVISCSRQRFAPPWTSNAPRKELLRVDRVQLRLPDLSDDAKGEANRSTPAGGEPSTQPIPGAFSMYAESIASSRKDMKQYVSNSAMHAKAENSSPDSQPAQTSVQIVFGSISAIIDVPRFHIVMRLLRKLQHVFGEPQPNSVSKAKPTSSPVKPTSKGLSLKPSLTVRIRKIEIGLLLDTEPATTAGSPISSPRDNTTPLFMLHLKDLRWSTEDLATLHNANLEVGKLRVRLGSEDLAWFSRSEKLSTSIRDTQELVNQDLTVSFDQSKGALQTTITTAPLYLSLDVLRLDETLESFGGFSGLLEIGSSFLSDAKLGGDSSPSPTKSRSVRFETLRRTEQVELSVPAAKINIRLGGASFTVKSKTCSVRYLSSSIKIVVRSSLLGVQIGDMRLSGPYEAEGQSCPASLRIRNLGLKYLSSPDEDDLDSLIALLTPSKDKFEKDDDFLASTLIKQRKRGTALRLNATKAEIHLDRPESVQLLQDMVTELTKLSAVAKYLPEETRPGMMTLLAVDNLRMSIGLIPNFGPLTARAQDFDLAHVGTPSLVALAMRTWSVENEPEHLVLHPVLESTSANDPPMLMWRMIGDELEPTMRFKLWNTCVEYEVTLLMKMMGIADHEDASNVAANLATSLANLPDKPRLVKSSTRSSNSSTASNADSNPTRIDFVIRDCAIGLIPRKLPSKGLLVLTDARIQNSLLVKDQQDYNVDIRKATLLLIDDVEALSQPFVERPASKVGFKPSAEDQIALLCEQGYVSVSWVSAASVAVKLVPSRGNGDSSLLDVEFKDELLVLETCADSTQTLSELFAQLKPPSPPSTEKRYLTEIAPIQDMMASVTSDAFAPPVPPQSEPAPEIPLVDQEEFEDALNNDFDYLGEYSDQASNDGMTRSEQSLFADEPHLMDVLAMEQSQELPEPPPSDGTIDSEIITGAVLPQSMSHELHKTAAKWNSANNRYVPVLKSELRESPLRIQISDVHIIWNLHDGYDWKRTRDAISKAVDEVASKAEERRSGRRVSRGQEDEDEESVIGDCLFNSIYIGVPTSRDPHELARQINRNVDDAASETTSHASTATTTRPGATNKPSRPQSRRLKLERSKRHKIAFELRGFSADIFVYPPGGETQSSIDVRIHDLEIFDHVPTSTWRKFATYMHDSGPREERKPMVHLEICDVRPVPELSASELVVRVTVLPLRLHVDQDALDFMARFFDFHAPSSSSSPTNNLAPTPPPPPQEAYLQRVEIRSIRVLLDYKPKKVDYPGLRSGRTTEFMNFFILDSARLTLKHTIVYGSASFASLHRSLEDVWMPDIRRNQLPSVLSGLNGVRTLVTVGSGLRDLVAVPMAEYKRDGRVVRSVSKGAMAFARTTGGELTRFGARLAIGAQTALQGAETLLSGPASPSSRHHHHPPTTTSSSPPSSPSLHDLPRDERPQISPYALQPPSLLSGLRGAALSLQRDLSTTRDAVIAVSGDVRDASSPGEVARAVAQGAPTVVLRPMIGASRAVGWVLMGATRSLDGGEGRRVGDKYKRG
ncbi:MAG: autophagy- protein 2 [Chrysothrix sp. TS-e1954]|nr:MAG: autophagy- protein 2 [Chrysothrix sp. TS-e1954]